MLTREPIEAKLRKIKEAEPGLDINILKTEQEYKKFLNPKNKDNWLIFVVIVMDDMCGHCHQIVPNIPYIARGSSLIAHHVRFAYMNANNIEGVVPKKYVNEIVGVPAALIFLRGGMPAQQSAYYEEGLGNLQAFRQHLENLVRASKPQVPAVFVTVPKKQCTPKILDMVSSASERRGGDIFVLHGPAFRLVEQNGRVFIEGEERVLRKLDSY